MEERHLKCRQLDRVGGGREEGREGGVKDQMVGGTERGGREGMRQGRREVGRQREGGWKAGEREGGWKEGREGGRDTQTE